MPRIGPSTLPPRCGRSRHAFLAALPLLTVLAGAGHAATLTVYGDALDASFQDWSWATHNLAWATSPHSGTYAISMLLTDYQGLYFHSNTLLSRSSYDSLIIWVKGGVAGQQVRVSLQRSSTTLGSASLQTYVAGGTVTTSWARAAVPLATLTGETTFDGITLQADLASNQGTIYFDDLTLASGSTPPATPDTVLVTVDPRLDRHAVSPLIYGVNWGDDAEFAALPYPSRRWGGNNTSRYSWQVDADNRGSDWFFMNIAASNANPGALPNGSSADSFVSRTRAAGAQTVLTVPTIGWVSKDRTKRWGFSVAKYGAQTETECTYTGNATWCTADAGNGVKSPSNQNVTGNDPLDTSVQVGAPFVTGWLQHLAARFGTASSGGVRYYALDNEPMLWNTTHRDVHPAAVTYDELWQKTLDYATAIKMADANAQVLGPVSWGWCEYFYSAADGCVAGADAAAHSGTPLLEWYLQQVRARQLSTGVRPVDLLDIHYYPQDGSALNDNESIGERRLRELKSLYDTTYVDESWIAQPVKLIPRMKRIIATRCPGLGLAITEYNFGRDTGISSALAQAEALAIFGREGVDLATRWVAPAQGTRVQDAFRLYLDYDGSGGAVTGQSVRSLSGDVDRLGAYAIEGTAGPLYVLLFNKDGVDVATRVTLADGVGGTAALYRFTAASALAAAGTASTAGARLNLTLPARSATLAVIQRGGATAVPATPAGPAVGLQLGVRPNPVRGPATLAFVMPRAGHATLTVHDVAGRRLATLLDADLSAGAQQASWDGADGAGRPLASGVYRCRLSAAGQVETRTVIRLR